MCIALISTSNPKYKLILLNNRDEYLHRPTSPLSFWAPPHSHVLSSRDELRSVQGTWLGITLDGRIACLTNFREEGADSDKTATARVSRGEMVKAFLTPPPPPPSSSTPSPALPSTSDFVHGLVSGEGARGAGGFSLVCGHVDAPLGVVSNRTSYEDGPSWIEDDTIGLSNAAFGDETWLKVRSGVAAFKEVLSSTDGDDKERFIERLLDLLSIDSMPERHGESGEVYSRRLRESIFIPLLNFAEDDEGEIEKGDSVSGAYGTMRQSVVLVDRRDKVTFVERSLWEGGRYLGVEGGVVRREEFTIQR